VRCFFDGAPIANAAATSQRLSNIRVSIPAEILAYARAAYPQRRSSNANSLQSQNSAGFRQKPPVPDEACCSGGKDGNVASRALLATCLQEATMKRNRA
jgi:hypothetical protein